MEEREPSGCRRHIHRDEEGSGAGLLVACIVICGGLLLALALFMQMCTVQPGTQPSTDEPPSSTEQPDQGTDPETEDYVYEWTDDDAQGEWSPLVAATHILLKANGITDITRERLTEIFEPLGEYQNTWSIDVSQALDRELPVELVAAPMYGNLVQFLPAPSLVWINTETGIRPVVFLYADEGGVTYVDPSEGVISEAFSVFSDEYDEAYRQAVYLADRGYVSREEA